MFEIDCLKRYFSTQHFSHDRLTFFLFLFSLVNVLINNYSSDVGWILT